MTVLDKTETDLALAEISSFNEADWERFRRLLSDDSVYEEPATQRRIEGADGIVDANRGWKRAFPDAHGTVTSASQSDDTVTLEITWEGTQSGPLETPRGELPASNRPVTVKAAEVFRFEGEKIKEAHHYFDMMGMLQQLGAE
jgi:steroid delta-isomerase-like uncharacterized protein